MYVCLVMSDCTRQWRMGVCVCVWVGGCVCSVMSDTWCQSSGIWVCVCVCVCVLSYVRLLCQSSGRWGCACVCMSLCELSHVLIFVPEQWCMGVCVCAQSCPTLYQSSGNMCVCVHAQSCPTLCAGAVESGCLCVCVCTCALSCV